MDMEKTRIDIVGLKIHIIPSNRNLSATPGFDTSIDGSNFSQKDQININKTADGYSVIFLDTVFKYLDIKLFIGNLIKILTTNITSTIFDVSINYHYTTSNCSYDYYDNDTARKIYELHETMVMLINAKQLKCLQYSESETLNKMFDDLNNTQEEDTEDSNTEIHDHSSCNHNHPHIDVNPAQEAAIRHLLEQCGMSEESEDIDDTDDDKEERNIKYHKKYYGKSRVFSNIKHPKQVIRKHNLLVTKSNSDIKDDIKILKSFLKDFIPGNSKWKKRFRDELLQRWIATYVISKKNMKKFMKSYNKKLKDEELDENISTLATLLQSYQNSK